MKWGINHTGNVSENDTYHATKDTTALCNIDMKINIIFRDENHPEVWRNKTINMMCQKCLALIG